MKKMKENPHEHKNISPYTMEGYLYVQEKRRCWGGAAACQGYVASGHLGKVVPGGMRQRRLIQQDTKSVKERDCLSGWGIGLGMWEPAESLPVPRKSPSPGQEGVNNA